MLSLKGCAPDYPMSLLSPSTTRPGTRSADARLLYVPRFKLESYGGRSLSINAPRIWNNLLLSVRMSSALAQFRSSIKTELFKRMLLCLNCINKLWFVG